MQKHIKRRLFLSAGISALGLAISGGGAAEYAYHIEPAWIEITTQSLSLSRLAPEFENYRIVQISDIHADQRWMDQARLLQIIQVVNAQQPDIIVITGDFISGLINKQKLATLASLQALQAKDGVFAVLGNHDHWAGPFRLRALLRTCGIQELNDQAHTLYRGNAMFHLVGLDDLWPHSSYVAPIWSHKDRLTSILNALPVEGATLLLVHEPDFADVAASTGRIDVQLSGHSHGGQVRLPLFGAIALPPLGRRYPLGLYRSGDMLHYTNRGVGMVSPLVRFLCRPEITVFTCHAASYLVYMRLYPPQNSER